MKKLFVILYIAVGAFGSVSAAAQQAANAEQKLRESLRSTMLQLRSLETERATLQANQQVNEAKIKELTDEIESLNKKIVNINKQAIADQEAAQKTAEGLRAKVTAQEKQIAELNASLAKWKQGYADAVKVARTKEAERAKSASKVIELQRTVADRERKNLELYQIGREILERYKNFGLGSALTAREPFVGNTRVRLQTLVQDYADKLQDNKYNPFEEKTTPQEPNATYDQAKGRPNNPKEAAEVEKPAPVATPPTAVPNPSAQ